MHRLLVLFFALAACSDKGTDSAGTPTESTPGTTESTPTTDSTPTDSTPTGGDEDSGTGPVGPTFDEFNAVLTAKCNGCHIGGGASGGLALDDPRASIDKAAGGGGVLIKCGDSAGSVLYTKTGATPPYGGTMPQGSGPLDDANRAIIAGWIDAGCP